MELKVITFNIRCCDDPDGHSIPERAPRLSQTTAPYDADIIGFQEYRPAWEEWINKYFSEEYEIFNKYRSSEEWDRESSPILWKKDKFECLKTGYFWLSDTPDVESNGWDELYHCYRICVYATLREKKTQKVFTFFNTHFGFGDNGQIKSVNLILDYFKQYSEHPCLIIGDFNMTPESPAYAEITKHLTDVNAVTAKNWETTYHGYFWGEPQQQHIDYCFIDDKIRPISQTVLDNQFDGKFPSDHYGLLSVLEI